MFPIYSSVCIKLSLTPSDPPEHLGAGFGKRRMLSHFPLNNNVMIIIMCKCYWEKNRLAQSVQADL